MAISVLLMLATGWQMGNGVCSNLEQLLAVHTTAGSILAVALVARVYLLLFGSGAERWQDFIPRGPQLRAAHGVLLFYLSAGRRELPPYYAHNPLWGTAYLFLFLVLALQVASGTLLSMGLSMGSSPALYGYPIVAVHRIGYVFLAVFSLLHIAAAFLHDLKGTGSEVSAMVSGSKIFIIRKPTQDLSAMITRFPVKVLGKKD
jgi:Ni/Fe-hydrogenase 1 B-type cytochrome subunit